MTYPSTRSSAQSSGRRTPPTLSLRWRISGSTLLLRPRRPDSTATTHRPRAHSTSSPALASASTTHLLPLPLPLPTTTTTSCFSCPTAAATTRVSAQAPVPPLQHSFHGPPHIAYCEPRTPNEWGERTNLQGAPRRVPAPPTLSPLRHSPAQRGSSTPRPPRPALSLRVP